MKIRTKLAIFVVATILSLAGFGVISNGLSVDKVMTAAQPSAQVYISITG
jgi:hypothetical protein